MIKYIVGDDGLKEVADWQERCWVNVVLPTEEELEILAERFGVPVDFLEDISDADERPRVERHDSGLLAIVRIPLYEENRSVPFFTVPVGIAVVGGCVTTICNFNNELSVDFVEHLKRRNISINSASDFIQRFLNSAAYWFLRYLKSINAEMDAEEIELERSVRNEDLTRLLKLQKSLVVFNTSIKGDLLLLERLKRVVGDEIDEDLFEDVDIELRQADSMVEVTTAMLDRTLDTYASVISNNVNAIMKRLTALSLVLMIPTLIASFYGMNVDIGIPIHNPWAFWIIIGVAGFLSVIGLFWFRRIKWL